MSAVDEVVHSVCMCYSLSDLAIQWTPCVDGVEVKCKPLQVIMK